MKNWFDATRGLFVTLLVGILVAFAVRDAVAEDAKLSPRNAPRSKRQSRNSWLRNTSQEFQLPWSKTDSSSGPRASAWPISKTSCRPHPAHCTGLPRSRNRSRRSLRCSCTSAGSSISTRRYRNTARRFRRKRRRFRLARSWDTSEAFATIVKIPKKISRSATPNTSTIQSKRSQLL